MSIITQSNHISTQHNTTLPPQDNSRHPRFKDQEGYQQQVQPKRLVKAKLGEQERCSANRTQNDGPAGICSASRSCVRRAEDFARRAEDVFGEQNTTDNSDDGFWPLARRAEGCVRRATRCSELKMAKSRAERERTRFRRKLEEM